jgi:2-oxo-4-hydroxy-4-carboxy--5-ureidoimidazoline (OHCU) decarboxylase
MTTPVEAAQKISDTMKKDPDLARSVTAMVHRAGCKDVFEWVNEHPDMAVAMADQLRDIEGQIANMDYLLANGDLS